MKNTIPSLAAFCIFACTVLSWAKPKPPAPALSKADCLTRHGKWGHFGRMVKEQCNLPTSDTGKACTDSGQCQSVCFANLPQSQFRKHGNCSGPDHQGKVCETVADCGGKEVCVITFDPIPGKGFCYGWTLLLGTCGEHVHQGMVSPPLCID
jgi:hypothetical protein